MSKFSKSDKSDKLPSRLGFKPSPPPANQPQKLEVVKIISPKPPEPIEAVVSQDEPEPVEVKAKAAPVEVEAASVAHQEANNSNDDASSNLDLHLQPIPPATESMQYRAIGVVQGRYVAQDDQFSKGQLVSPDGTSVEAVLLGKTISIVKKRLDLAKDYLWVVYPRTRDKTGELHVQIAGVWAPVEMGKSEHFIDPGVEDGYFSIRGEVVFQSVEQNYVMIKVQRSDQKKELDKSRTKFKLRLAGILPTNAVNHFWNINAQREGNNLNILDGQAIAPMPAKSRKPSRKPNQQPIGSKRPFKPKPKQIDGSTTPVPRVSGSSTSTGTSTPLPIPRLASPVQRPSHPVIKRPKQTDS